MSTPRHAEATTLGVDAGWAIGTLSSTSDSASFTFNLTNKAYFSLTDCCAPGDIYTIAGSFTGSSTVGLSAFTGLPMGIGSFPSILDPNWMNAALSHFQKLLLAGSYTISISGNGGGSFPASFGVRLDTAKSVSAVPLPAGLPMLLVGIIGLAALGLRRKSV